MISTATRSLALFLLAAALIGSIAAPTSAQGQKSPSELRRENERLAEEVADLTRELEAARKENQELNDEIKRLNQLLTQAGQTARGVRAAPPELEPEEVTIDETVPNASPRALLNALKASYREAAAEFDAGDPFDDGNGKTLYLRHLNRWSAKTNRELRSTIEWNVRLVDPNSPAIRVGRGYVLRLQAVDPVTDSKLGDPFDVLLSKSLATRIEDRLRREGLDNVVLLRGVLSPRIHINESRVSEGAFDNPRFIGAYAEFGFSINVQTLLPRPAEAEEASAGSTPVER